MNQETKNYHIRDLIVDNDKIDENICCGICQELAIDAKECRECQHLFCQPCITAWKSKSNQCPFKCNPPIKLKEPHRFVRNVIENLKVKCPNFENGCQNICSIEVLPKHINECQFSIQQCPNEGCAEKVIKKDILQHEQECPYRKWKCQKCQSSIPYQQKQNHDCIYELQNKVNNYAKMIEILTQKFEASLLQQQEVNQQLMERIAKLEIPNQNQYVCKKNHQLSWTCGTLGEQCTQCKTKERIIRYVCVPCKEQFCQKCKPPLFKNGRCPLNHALKLQEQPSPSIICDFCECRPALGKINNWNDGGCDFDVCDNCKKKFN